LERRSKDDVRSELAAGHDIYARWPDEDPRRDDSELDHGDFTRHDFRLHGSCRPVRKLHPTDCHHAGAAALDTVRASDPPGDQPNTEPVERSGCALAPGDRQEEFDSSGGLCERATRPRYAAARGGRPGVPDATPTNPDDDVRDCGGI